jgi:hypothetical protein
MDKVERPLPMVIRMMDSIALINDTEWVPTDGMMVGYIQADLLRIDEKAKGYIRGLMRHCK